MVFYANATGKMQKFVSKLYLSALKTFDTGFFFVFFLIQVCINTPNLSKMFGIVTKKMSKLQKPNVALPVNRFSANLELKQYFKASQ